MATNPSNLAAALLYKQEQDQRRKSLVQPQSVEDVVQDTFGMQPGLDRATFLPMAGTRSQKNMQFAAPGIVYDAAKALATPLAAWRGANVTPEDAFNVAGNVMGGGLSASALRPVESGVIGANVYHGTPHQFPATEANPLGEFNASKIGTGEGAQAYGHGLYFAESPDVAKSYATKLSANELFINGKKVAEEGPQEMLGKIGRSMHSKDTVEGALFSKKGNLNAAIKMADSFAPTHPAYARLSEQLKALRGQKVEIRKPGNLYNVDIPDSAINNMLDWDKTLSEQPESVRKALGGIESKFPEIPDFNLRKWMDADPLASTWHNVLQRDLGADPAMISSTLKDRGIPGIRYLDGGSRGAAGNGRWTLTFKDGTERIYDFKPNDDVLELMGATAKPHGTSNFVVFPGEEKRLKILERK